MIEWKLVLVQMRTASAVLRFNKAKDVMAVSGISAVWDACGAVAEDTTSSAVGVNAASCVLKTNFSIARQKWFALLSTQINPPMISLDSRLYFFSEYEGGWSPQYHTVAASKNRRALIFGIPLLLVASLLAEMSRAVANPWFLVELYSTRGRRT